MMTKIKTFFLKKCLLGKINELLQGKDIASKKQIVDEWIVRLSKVLNILRSFSAKLDDNKLTDEETDAIIAETKAFIEEW